MFQVKFQVSQGEQRPRETLSFITDDTTNLRERSPFLIENIRNYSYIFSLGSSTNNVPAGYDKIWENQPEAIGSR